MSVAHSHADSQPIHFVRLRAAVTQSNDSANGWTLDAVSALFDLPLMDLLFRAQQVHRAHFEPNRVQLSTLLSIKTGGCPEDCAYCPQSAQYDTDVTPQAMLSTDTVLEHAKRAKAAGATRFCMGAAWRGPSADDIQAVLPTIRAVKALGLETCGTFGLLRDGQAEQLKAEGLDYYNHNLDTSAEHYGDVISTRQFEDRLDTLRKVRAAHLKMCCGGIVGMGESRRDRAGLIATLASLAPPPESVPINALVPIAGTPLGDTPPLDPFEFVRTIACARITMPTSYVRLSAGRETMSDELQALCWLAGANSLFYGETLLTASNPDTARDAALFERLGLVPEV